LVPVEQDLRVYLHMGSRRKAKATVASTVKVIISMDIVYECNITIRILGYVEVFTVILGYVEVFTVILGYVEVFTVI